MSSKDIAKLFEVADTAKQLLNHMKDFPKNHVMRRHLISTLESSLEEIDTIRRKITK